MVMKKIIWNKHTSIESVPDSRNYLVNIDVIFRKNILGYLCVWFVYNNGKWDKLIVKEKTMKNLSMKTLITTTLLIVGLFGIVRADETTTTGVSVSG